MNDVSQIFILLLAFQLKQFFCDYPIYPEFLLKRFKGSGLTAFIVHSGIHSFMTLGICLILSSSGFGLAVLMACLDFVIDFMLNQFRSRSETIARFRPLDLDEFLAASRKEKRNHRLYWAFFGLDQTIHHLTHYAIVFVLCEQGAVWMM